MLPLKMPAQEHVSNSKSHIPIVNFGCADDEVSQAQLGQQLVHAFCSAGFVYLKNHGVQEATIQNAMSSSRQFFELPLETKLKYQRAPGTTANSGFVYAGMERLNAFLEEEHTKQEIREAYNFYPYQATRLPVETPDFEKAIGMLFDESTLLTRRIFRCLAAGLNLEHRVFENSHKSIGQPGNPTTLRTLWYPPFTANESAAADVTRCGTHSDYGTITLLYQDDVGGLEVENRDDEFMPATNIPGCVLVNVADLLQRWTSNKLRSTRHRVGFQGNVASRTRQSMAFFVHPDDDFVVTCLDGTNKYPPVSAGAYLQEKFSRTY